MYTASSHSATTKSCAYVKVKIKRSLNNFCHHGQDWSKWFCKSHIHVAGFEPAISGFTNPLYYHYGTATPTPVVDVTSHYKLLYTSPHFHKRICKQNLYGTSTSHNNYKIIIKTTYLQQIQRKICPTIQQARKTVQAVTDPDFSVPVK